MTFDDWTKKQREKNKGSSQRNTQRKGEDVAAATFSVGGMNGSKPVTNTGKSTSKRNVQVTVGNPATYGNTKYKSSTKKSTSPANKTFDQWTAEQRAGGNARSWAQGVSDLVNEAGSYYSSWSSDADKRTRDFQERAAAYMSAANKYKGSFQNASDYDDLYSALKNVTPYASQMGDMYSNFYSQKQYDQAVQVASWQKKYQNYSYSQKRAAIEKMKKNNPSATVDERKWLEQNIDSGMTAQDYDEYIKQKQNELAEYKKTWNGKSTASLADAEGAANEYYTRKSEIENDISRAKSRKYMLEKQDEYAAVKNNADFSRFSKVKPAGNVLNGGDIREIISNPHKEHGSIVTDWSDEDWTQDEIDTATYIYNTQGKKAAQAYWDDYLKYVVLERADKRKRQEYADYATRNVGTGILASLGSVGATLASGQGLLSAAGQNIRNKLVGDEGYRPINYYGNAFDATRQAASTRGAISEYLDKEYGTIQLDEQKNPFWSKLLNGKGAGFAYQTAMSMADSGALAALTMGLAPAIGEAAKFTTVLLGGSAGSQGVLDALERGASDEQALMMGILNGTFEALFEEVSLDHLIHPDKNFLVNLLKQGFIEGSEEVSTSFMNNIADIAIMASNSEYMQKAQEYMDQGFSEEEALRKALASIAVDIGWDFVGGAISGGLMGGMSGARATIMRNGSYANLARGMEAQDVISDLQSVDPNSKLAARMQTKLDNRGDLSTWNKSRMLNQTEQAVLQRDAENVRSAVVDRLTELGETANVDKIADAIVDIVTAKQMNEEASRRSARAIEDSTYGNRVLNELASENSEGFSAEWTKGINTEILGRANQDVYMFRRAVRNFINKNEESLAEEGYNVVRDENGNAIGLESAMPEEAPADINELSRKYGKGYQTFLDNYEEGQDVESYDQAFGDVYQMGNSGLTLESAKQAMEGSILSDKQIRAAYQAGRDAADVAAASLANENRGKALQTNKKGWRRGSVSADGVTMKDLDTAFQQIANERGEKVRDFVRKAVDMMRVISEATGVDVVLYQSSTDENGKFQGAQGRYEWKDSKIYVDINAGLNNISEAGDIGKYIMMQTFTHEFVHFMEQWSPSEFNELRDLVFQEIAKKEDVDALIRDKQRRLGGDISYDQASKEVVADGLSRLLPQSKFVENLAAEHQNIFQRLMAKLKEFLNDLKEHFGQLGQTNQREIGYLTEDVDGQIQYVQDIVDLFDYVAQNAVENYQQTLEGFPEAKMEQAVETTEQAIDETATQEKPKKPKRKKYSINPHEALFGNLMSSKAATPEDYIAKYPSIEQIAIGHGANWSEYKKVSTKESRENALKKRLFQLFDEQNRRKNTPIAIKNEMREGRRAPAAPYSGKFSTADKVTSKQRQSMAKNVAIGSVPGESGVYWVCDGYHMIFASEEAVKKYADNIKTGSASTRTLMEDKNLDKSIEDALKAFADGKLLTTRPVEVDTNKGQKILLFENDGTYSGFNPQFVESLDGGAFYFATLGEGNPPSLFATNKNGDLVGFTLPIKLKEELLKFAPTLFEWAEEYDNQTVELSDREAAFDDLTFEQAEQYINAGLPVAPEAEVEWSIRTNQEQMDNTEEYVAENGNRITKKNLKAVRKLREQVADYLEKNEKKLNLPNEVIGNPFVKNGAYDKSYDPTTVCVRSLGVLRLQQLVSEKLGRPLTARENFEIAQEAFQWTDNPQCLYCFAALDRMAKSEYLMDFINRQNRAVKALNDGASKTAAYKEFLPDGHKGSSHMKKVFNGIYERWQNKGRLLTLKDASTYEKLGEIINRDDVGGIGELAYWAEQYAQNASWAKAQRQYQAYNGQILKWSQDEIDTLNSHYGLRLNSHSEFSPAFILEYLQIYTDAAARGLKALEYTSDINAAKIFAPTGAAINMSISIVGDSYDNMGMDAMQGCDWNEARAVREQYDNAGIVAVALNDEQTRWALDQDWIDVVIPMHLVKTGDEIAKFMNWTNTKAISDDKKQKGKWKKGTDEAHIYPSMHLNDKATYLRALEENHLTPRFQKWLDNPNYMKLVNETRQATTEMKPLQPVFDEDALWSAIHMMEARGGYFERLGHTEEGEEYIADEMTERFKKGPRYFEGNPRGKAAADVLGDNVEYSRRIEDINTDYMAAVESGDEAEQQKYVDEAAMAAGAISENGKPVQLYHGTQAFGFTWFDRDMLDDSLSIFLTDNPDVATTYSGSIGTKRIFEKDEKIDVDNLSDEEIAARLNKIYGKEEVIAVSSEQLEKKIGESLSIIHQRAEKAQSVLDNEKEFNAFKERHAYDIKYIPEIGTLSENYLRAVASLKEADKSYEIARARGTCSEILRDIRHYFSGGSVFELTEDLEDLAGMNPHYLRDVETQFENRGNDVFTISGYESRIYPHEEMVEKLRYMLSRENAQGNYAVYAFAPALLEIDANGEHWNAISWLPEEVKEAQRKYNESLQTIEDLEKKYPRGADLEEDDPDLIAYSEAEMARDKYYAELESLEEDLGQYEMSLGTNRTRSIAAWASDHGYDGVKFEGIYDSGGAADGDYQSNVYVIFYPNDVKSSDPITYDDDGNVIPLTERFNPNEQDIRYSKRETDEKYMKAVESGDMDTAQRMVDEEAKRAFPNSKLIQDGEFKKMWHHTSKEFTSFLPGTSKSSGGLKGIYFTPQETSTTANLGTTHKAYYLNVENPKFAFGIKADRQYVMQLRDLQEGVTDRQELAEINRRFKEETGVDAFFDWQNGWYNVMTPEQIKSADPVTYDDNGNVIPLSQRFNTEEADVRRQQRTEAITDAELLQMSAENLLASPDLTEGEREALNIISDRLATLQDLKDQRAELGHQYREQQFTQGGDRAAAQETLAKMKILDQKIERAQNAVLSVKDKQVLKDVLQKARKNLESIDREKAREMVSRYRDRRDNAEAIRKYKKRINRDASEITKWIVKPNGKDAMKNVSAVIRDPIIQILQSIDRTSQRMLSGGAPTKADMVYLEQMKKLQAAMSTRVNRDELYTGYSDLPENFMENLNKIITATDELASKFDRQFVINQMTADELKTLADFVTVLKSYIHKATRTLSLVGNVSDLGDSSIEDMSEIKSLNTKGAERFMMWQTMRPMAVFDRFGRGGQKVFRSLMKGQSQLAFDTKEVMKFAEDAYTSKEAKEWTKTLITVKLGGEDVQMPISYAMGLYELSKRKNAEGHLYGNGVRIATFKNGRQKISDQGHRITPQEIAALKSQLNKIDPRIIEVADALQQYMAEKGAEWGNYVSVARFGIEQFTEQDYYPIASDGTYLPASADEKPALASLYALLNMSFTKDLKENANNRAMVYDIFDVFANHMSSMAQYHSFALPVLDSLKWLNYQQFMEDEDGNRLVTGSVREQMARLFGRDAENGKTGASYAEAFVTNILKAINGTSAQGDSFDSLGMKALHAYNVSRIAYNVRVVMQQPMAITRAAMVMSPTSISRALARPDKVRANIQEMESKNGIAAWKGLGFYDVNVSRSMTELIKHDETAIQKINEFGLLGAEVADKVTWAVMWQAAKNEVQRKTKLTPKDAGYWDAVNEIFDETIYRTQVVDSVLTKNEYLRSKSYFARATGSFMNEPMTTYSMLASAYDKFRMDRARGMSMSEAWKKNGKNIARTAAVYSVSAILLSVVQAVADAWRDDDRYETYGEKWWEAFTGNIIDELVPFNNLPMFSDVWNFAKKMASLFGVDTYGSDPRQLWLEFGQELYDGTKRLIDLVTKPDEAKYTWYGSIYKLLGAASGLTGMPLSTTTREVVSAWNNTVAHFAPSLRILDYNPGAKNEIKYAYADGYLTKEEALQLLTDPEVMNDEVLDENDAYWLVKGWTEGESTSKYGRLYKAMLENAGDFDGAMKELTTHGVKEKDAISQVKSTVGKWYRGEEETTITRDQAKKMLINYVGMKEADAEKLLDEWTMKRDTGIAYGDMKQAYLDGDLSYSDAVNYRVKYGGAKEEDAIATVVKWNSEKDTGIAYDDVKQAYLEGNITYDAAVQNRVKYGGADEDDAEEAVAKWNVEKETGYTYDNMKEAYMSGAITYDQAVNYRVKYGNVSRDTAMKTVNDWKGEKASGYAKDDVDDAFMKGKITSSEALKAYLSHGYDSDEAHQKVELLEFRKKYPAAKDIKYNAMRDYKEYCEADGIPVDTFVKVWEYNSKTKADVDANGNSINGSKRVKVLAYIDELPISDYEKDSLYYACGYAPSTLKNAPWHQR